MVRTIDTAKSRGGLAHGQPARLQNRVRSGFNQTLQWSFLTKSLISKKISSLNAPERIQDEKIKRLEANVESLNKLFEQVAQENRNTRKSVELTILDRIKDTRAYVDRKYADVTDDLNKEPSLKIILVFLNSFKLRIFHK